MTEYKAGDVANGHRLTEDGHWVPVDSPAPTHASPKKRRRVFLWVFLAVQLLFIVWIFGGVASVSSDAECADNAACAVGAGIGAFMILVLWAIVDFLMAVTYAVYRLATRK
jgi:hypothetical protein